MPIQFDGQKYYTLIEADAMLKTRECVRDGHNFDHIVDFHSNLRSVHCKRCGRFWVVQDERRAREDAERRESVGEDR